MLSLMQAVVAMDLLGFGALVESSPDLIVRYDRSLRCVYANPAIATLLGKSPAALIGRTNANFNLPPQSAQQLDLVLQQVFAGQQPLQLRLELPTANGVRFFRVQIIPEPDATGTVISVLSVARDITLERQVLERTTLLQRVLSFEALLKRITDKVRDSLDEQQIMQAAVQELGAGLNVACCNASLYSPDQTQSFITCEYADEMPAARGKTLIFAKQPTPEIYRQLLQATSLEFCFLAADPTYSTPERHAILAYPLTNDHTVLGDLWLYKPAVECFNELERRLVAQVANQCAIALRQSRLFQAAQTQVESLERLNALKDNFLNTISHELRTPMCSIKMAIQMLEIVLKPLGVFDPEVSSARRYFQILQDECQREINLIDDLLDLSRLEAGTEPLILSKIDPAIWVSHAIEPFRDRLQAHNQHLHLELPPHLPPLMTDLSYLGRILSELMDNACKYSPPDSTITVALAPLPLATAAPATTLNPPLQLTISNTGVEIPSTELPHIFETFYRVPSSDPWRHRGAGLGLALVKKLAAHLGITIQVDSCQGQTTFTMVFPS
jgi:PAS domain S-box-containing protein